MIGKDVMVKSAKHPDVLVGTIGKVTCQYSGGFGIKIHGSWLIAGGERGQKIEEDRVIWYDPSEIVEMTL